MLEGTGQWLLRKAEFRKWRSSHFSSILWLHGIRKPTLDIKGDLISNFHLAGAGKTKLTYVIQTRHLIIFVPRANQ